MTEYFWKLFERILHQELQGIHISNILLVTVSALAAVFLIQRFFLNKGKLNNKEALFHMWMFFEYAGILLLITVFRRSIGGRGGITGWYGFGFNIHGIYSPVITILVLLNVLLFIPWGILISLYGAKRNAIPNILFSTAIGFICSLCIELIQLFTETGFFEGMDLFANTTGTFIGALIGQLILKAVNIR